jgi:hypothetical protein
MSLLERLKLRSIWTGVANTLFAVGIALLFVSLYSQTARSNYLWAVALGVLAVTVFCWLVAAQWGRESLEPELSPVVEPEWQFRGTKRLSTGAPLPDDRLSGTRMPASPLASASADGPLVHETAVSGNHEYDEYMRYAQHCTRMAEQGSDPKTQASYRELARRWRELARQALSTQKVTE